MSLEDLRIIGSHPGKLLATCGDISIEPKSRLFLEVAAKNVFVRGLVKGNVKAIETVEVGPTGRVYGDVSAAKIIVQDGGVIQGRCSIVRRCTPVRPDAAANPQTPDVPETDADRPVDQFSGPPQPPRRSETLQIRPIQLD